MHAEFKTFLPECSLAMQYNATNKCICRKCKGIAVLQNLMKGQLMKFVSLGDSGLPGDEGAAASWHKLQTEEQTAGADNLSEADSYPMPSVDELDEPQRKEKLNVLL